MIKKKVRVETVIGEGGNYRDPAVEQRVSADARVGLTRRWRKLPAFIADLAISFATFLGFVAGMCAMGVISVIADEGLTTRRGLWFAFFAVLAPTLYIGGSWLDRRRKKWRDERRAHDESVLTIGRDALRFNGRTVKKTQITCVRVEKRRSSAPASEGAIVEVRFNVVLDVEGAESITALEALQEQELATVLAALDEGGLEVDG